MITINEVESHIKTAINSLAITPNEIKRKRERIARLRQIKYYLESNPREEFLREKRRVLAIKVSHIDGLLLNCRSMAPDAAAKEMDYIKRKHNYKGLKNQLDNIKYILN